MKSNIKKIALALVLICVGFMSFMYLAQQKEKDKLATYFLLEKDGTLTKGTHPLEFTKINWQDSSHPGVQIPFLDGKPILSKIGDKNGIMYQFHPYLMDKTDAQWNISTIAATELNSFHFGEVKYLNLTSGEMKDYQLIIKLKRQYGGFDILARRIVEGKDSLPSTYMDAPFNLNQLVQVEPQKPNEDIYYTVAEW